MESDTQVHISIQISCDDVVATKHKFMENYSILKMTTTHELKLPWFIPFRIHPPYMCGRAVNLWD